MCYLEKWHIKVQIFRLPTVHIKIYQICDAISGAKSQFFFKLCIIFSIKTLLHFFMKTNQISYVIFPTTSQVSFKFCITSQCYEIQFRWNFLAETSMQRTKEPIKIQFSRLACFNESSPNSSCHFWNHKVRV